MMQSIRSMFKIQELRQRLLFTLFVLFLSRVGAHVPLPGIDAKLLAVAASGMDNTLLGLWDMFAGGALSKATVFALGIMPYISTSIIITLLGSVFPYFQRLRNEGEAGRRKITQITRYGTVFLAAMQAWAVAKYLMNLQVNYESVVAYPGFSFILMTMISLITGTILLMWLGEQITDRGIGNGISLIIMINIISRLPVTIASEVSMLRAGARDLLVEIILILILVIAIGFVVYLTQGTRKIPVQYAKKVVGRKIYGGQSTYIPLRVNSSGVMPIIFAQTIVFIPNSIGMLFSNVEWLNRGWFSVDNWPYWLIYSVIIVLFAYFYTAIAFNPTEVADNMKKNGGFIPGIRPGKKTAEYLDNIITRITLPGAIMLALVAILPYILMKIFGIDYNLASFFGGTSIIILVGVALDTLQQIESHLISRHYDGFMKKGKIKGRSRF
ncbi:MAG: preprotein translocase subunit SecY [Candidatus Marinimicrobia bacterium]|jgi:preprotein translocase subunit SecY|nr:preprotein translocase subunit SecY [Candidatus Neomarinimicrobiota bacterium]MDD4960674.1 preprotein translocase subunit SecY [Candidatus Neomarinimicrobiota bacterium]MDD5709207.1 preprotein translocase subunit SecY [Candidatus Neomarinimicrobiota bacterium]MDX9777924.1 preprotein translocase subunit SecY [bacterium]